MKISTNVTLDADIKKQAVELFSSFGLDLSTAIGLFLSQSVREQRIPFEIRREIPNAGTLEALKEAKDILANKDKHKGYSSLKEIIDEEGL